MISQYQTVLRPRCALYFAFLIFVLIALPTSAAGQGSVANQGVGTVRVMGDPVDVSQEFLKSEDTYFVGSKVTAFDTATGKGSLQWQRNMRRTFFSFNKMDRTLTPDKNNEFPPEYDENPTLPFLVEFVTPRTIRLRINTSSDPIRDEPSLMLVGNPPKDNSWKVEQDDKSITYRSTEGSLTIVKDPWEIQIRDKAGKLLTTTQNINITRGSFSAPLPFSFIRRAEDFGRQMAAAFRLSPDEKIFGLGESFTRLNKRGQKIIVAARDGMGVQTSLLYKPIPFFMSSNGYGMFLHTSTPLTMDIGNSFDQSNIIYLGDGSLDCFIFLGEPKDILSEYTALTGRSPVPPLWSFGFWMSRITYKAEDEVREVAAKLRQNRIPTDVIHLDTGWFETDWRSDYKFSTTRFHDPAKMIADLKRDGFHISLWQYTYFTRKNSLYPEIVNNGLAVRNPGGLAPDEDATLDFSNPATVKWYQDKLAGLLKLGVGAIKVDFGEGAPYNGLYASGRTGLYEHNLYPLRYNKAVADITKQITGESIIWARSAWAGSQRYPLHWGGDAENTNSAMAAELRGGLSFGLSGFTYWSHDAGGFVEKAPRELYRRWLGFSVLTSHSRAHGAPPREPWGYDPEFVDIFRRTVELKYQLMPYIIAQAKESSAHGYPMLRTLFFEFPNDPTSWFIEDEYMFGSDLLVAPLIEDGDTRRVYLPPGSWIDYQSGKVYAGAQWHQLTAGQVPVIVLAKDHTVIPHIAIAQSTAQMDWKNIELRVFSTDQGAASGLFALPDGNQQRLSLNSAGGGYALQSDPLAGQVKWKIMRVGK
ncbi:MAG TPA: TIM-barrel domain-containing protein [Pyrinomonadaceae bacterium]|nr:TIM-barrel domain-containing protein [Pyrinomonadaceae bacterium]